MVSKLLLAVQENFWWARARAVASAATPAATLAATPAAADPAADPAVLQGLAAAYYDIRGGIGFNKAPGIYGAFPTDPYSHTPKGQGAKQPGMTGQVKEEILTRFGELGLRVEGGAITFDPVLLRPEEFLTAPAPFDYIDLAGRPRTLPLPAGRARLHLLPGARRARLWRRARDRDPLCGWPHRILRRPHPAAGRECAPLPARRRD